MTRETFESIVFWIPADAAEVDEVFFMRGRELFCFAIETSAMMLLQCLALGSHLRTSRCARNDSTAASRKRKRFPTRM